MAKPGTATKSQISLLNVDILEGIVQGSWKATTVATGPLSEFDIEEGKYGQQIVLNTEHGKHFFSLKRGQVMPEDDVDVELIVLTAQKALEFKDEDGNTFHIKEGAHSLKIQFEEEEA